MIENKNLLESGGLDMPLYKHSGSLDHRKVIGFWNCQVYDNSPIKKEPACKAGSFVSVSQTFGPASTTSFGVWSSNLAKFCWKRIARSL
jgi:hypothetical protein